MSYFEKWKSKPNQETVEIHEFRVEQKNVKSTKITDFIVRGEQKEEKPNKYLRKIDIESSNRSSQSNEIKVLQIPDKPPEVIDYSGPVTIEKVELTPRKQVELKSFLDNFPQDNTIYVYTDGSCINNGKKNAKAGIGIYFGEKDPRNVSRPVEGKQTNNVAELTAIITALDILKNEISEGRRITVFTDSEYCIKCFTTFGRRLYNNGFITKDPVPNLDLIKLGFSKIKPNVIFQHIRSHTGKKDEHSLGNEEAARLANLAIGIESKAPRIYLRVSYGNRDQAKELGAKWDKKKKMWYVHHQGHKAVQVFGILTN